MGHRQCWVFGLLLSLLATQCDPVDRVSDRRRWSSPDGKTHLAAVSPRTADGRPDLSGWWVTGPSRDATRIFRPANCRPKTSPILPGPPKGGWSTNFELRIWWRHAEAKCASTVPSRHCTALPTGPSGFTLADTPKGHPDFGPARHTAACSLATDRPFCCRSKPSSNEWSSGKVGIRYAGRSDQRFSGRPPS
jgi:hypothetical protein